MRRSSFVTLAVGAVTLAGTLATLSPVAAASPATPSDSRYVGTPGIAEAVHGSQPASATSPSSRPRGTRLLNGGAANRTTTASTPAASPASGTATGTVLQNFNGVSSLDSAKTNFNAEFQPPDQGLCAGNGFVLEAVNSAYSIFKPNGIRVRGPFNINDLFNEGAAEFTSDPRCWYDKPTHTWFAIILYLNSSFTASRLDLAVNTSGDPTSLWQQYHITTTNPGGRGCPCFGDQPLLGIDATNIYISTNEFSINGPEFNGAQIYAVDKSDLLAGTNAHVVAFNNLRIAGMRAASVQPALTTGASNAEYFLNSLDPSGAGDNRIGVWAMTNRDAVGHGGSPVLTNKVIRSEPYQLPPQAEQDGSTSPIDSGDDRMQQAEFIGGTLWGELTTGVRIPNDPTTRAGAAWFAVRPRLTGDHISGAGIARQGYVVQRGGYVIYPAIQPDAAGRAAMVFTVTGAQQFPSAAYSVLGAGAAAFGPIGIAAAGSGPYLPHHGGTRWGDYSFAVPAPDSDSAWLATGYVPPPKSQTPDGEANWGTRVFEVKLH
ncbi:MAG: hypothetical protein WCB04_13610 [Mycobacteriales bacterium]